MASLEESYNNSIRESSIDRQPINFESNLKELQDNRNNFKPNYIRSGYFDTNVAHSSSSITVDNRSDMDKFYEVESMNRRILTGPSRIMTNEERIEIDAKFKAIDPKDWKHPPLSNELYEYYLKNIKNTRNKNTNCIVF